MSIYKSKYARLPGTSYREVVAEARREYHSIQKRTPRRAPYVRSQYFKKDKIFLNTFWDHLRQKHYVEQLKRLKYYPASIDLLRNTTIKTSAFIEHNNPDVFLHRFMGQTKDGHCFYVQVKDDRRSGRKDLMSIFPANSSRK